MSLSSIERKPPPFFRQGPSALTKLVLFSALALFLMAADTRLQLTGPLRAALATALRPVQQALMLPARLAADGAGYLGGFRAALAAADGARVQLVKQSVLLAKAEQLQQENGRLRALLELRPALTVRALGAEVLYTAADPYSRKVFIDRGSVQGVVPGSPTVNEQGVLGQVTAVYPFSAEVTLLADRDAAIPVLNRRTQQRAAAYGGVPGGLMELRFVAANADVQPGDLLTTSGVDGIYPPNLVVGQVARVDRRSDAGFARILVRPAASADGVRHLLVLEPLQAQLPAPLTARGASAPAPAPAPARPGASAAPRGGAR
jgi:rod shape-determining protein MreC